MVSTPLKKQDKVLLGLNSGADAAAAYRILQQQGFAVQTFTAEDTADSPPPRPHCCRCWPSRPPSWTAPLSPPGIMPALKWTRAACPHIITAVDAEADQSALLADLPRNCWPSWVLPLGEFSKADAAEIAAAKAE